MKTTVGIIGGCGPLATVDIESKILKATQKLNHPLLDQDYFNLLVLNRTQFSDRNDAIVSGQEGLSEEYLRCAKMLESIGIDLLMIACNTAHVYLPKLKSETNTLVIDIVQETARFIGESLTSVTQVGLLSTDSTQNQKLYQKALEPYGIEVMPLSLKLQKKVMQAIYVIKAGFSLDSGKAKIENLAYSRLKKEKQMELKNHPYRKVLTERYFQNPITILQEAMDYLERKDCRHIILGCTELPLILPHIPRQTKLTLIDPNSIVAESVVNAASKLEQERMERLTKRSKS